MAANLLQIDRDLAEAASMQIGIEKDNNVRKISFQFPPKILSDGRSGTWDDSEQPGDQPISNWRTSGARKWTLEWTYVIGVNGWSTADVKKQILTLRGYYTKKGELASTFIVGFKMWNLGGPNPMSCRFGNIDISHGKALYIPSGNVNEAFPVITNVKVGMQLWTRGNAEMDDGGPPKILINGLISAVPPEWQ
ncbi:MAG: hypothetical protein M0R50_11115 [Candidatus Cloacimonetes bacterium]|jgi:hypothetical protein|nr:hypothetical protein [Candidatus Cloacimonadota bacterium]